MANQALVPENINLNTENIQECLKTVNNWGNTVHQNVCNGTETVVPWGSLDYILAYGFAAFAVVMVLMFVVMLFRIALDY